MKKNTCIISSLIAVLLLIGPVSAEADSKIWSTFNTGIKDYPTLYKAGLCFVSPQAEGEGLYIEVSEDRYGKKTVQKVIIERKNNGNIDIQKKFVSQYTKKGITGFVHQDKVIDIFAEKCFEKARFLPKDVRKSFFKQYGIK